MKQPQLLCGERSCVVPFARSATEEKKQKELKVDAPVHAAASPRKQARSSITPASARWSIYRNQPNRITDAPVLLAIHISTTFPRFAALMKDIVCLSSRYSSSSISPPP
jgi:hypothetical protein